MRIGINTLFLIPGEVGGSQTYLTETLMAMSGLYPGDTFILFTNHENNVYLRGLFTTQANVLVELIRVRATRRGARILREQTELPFRAGRAKLDVLWSPGYTAPAFCAVPQVVSILDMQYKQFPMDLSFAARIATDILVRLAASRCERILTLSAFSRAEILRYFPKTDARVDVCHLAASPPFSEPCDLDASSPEVLLGLRDIPFLLCVANTYPHKNVDRLVQAFGLLNAQGELRLVLVGGARRGETQVAQALQDLPESVRQRVVRINRVELAGLVWLYQHCQAFIFPSLYEGFGLPILEAMLAGVPVVAADTEVTREIGGERVLRCDARDARQLADTIQPLLERPAAWRTDWCRQARDHARHFTWEATAKATHASLELATERPSPRPD